MENIDLKTVKTIKNEDNMKCFKSEYTNVIKLIDNEIHIVDNHSINIKEEDISETISNHQQELRANVSAGFEQVFIKDIKTEMDTEDDTISDADFNIKTEESEYKATFKVNENVTVTSSFTLENVNQIESKSDGVLFHNIEEERQKKEPPKQEYDIGNKTVKKIRKDTITHTKLLYTCTVCHKKFTQSSNLTAHMRIHTGDKPHECDICKKTFSEAGNLTKHMLIHTGEKPYECNICKKKFSMPSNLTKHMIIHTGEKPHECGICQKTFSEAGNLTKHLLIHTGDKPHECNVCKKTFSWRSSLKAHMTMHTGEKLHECGVCNKKFSQTSNLTKHMRIHTGDNLH